MPICPNCGKEFQENIEYATDEEYKQLKITIERVKKWRLYIKIEPIAALLMIILLFVDLPYTPPLTPFWLGFTKGWLTVGILITAYYWILMYREIKRVTPLLKKIGVEA